MLILISPTKQMDFESQITEAMQVLYQDVSFPVFQKEALELNARLKKYNRTELENLMKISPGISKAVSSAITAFGKKENVSRPAILAYTGTVFKAIDIASLTEANLYFARNHIRILSGMYGILKPADLIESYRLEMKTPLKVGAGQTLNSFWKDKVTAILNTEEVLLNKKSPIINLASAEYLKAVDLKKLENPLININFKDDFDGRLRTVGMYSKLARGKMVRRIITEKINNQEILKSINNDGYVFNNELSNSSEWIYIKKH